MPLSGLTNTTEPAEPTRGAQEEPTEQEIDLKALAEKIYELLKEEARLERERLGRHQTW